MENVSIAGFLKHKVSIKPVLTIRKNGKRLAQLGQAELSKLKNGYQLKIPKTSKEIFNK